MDARSPNLRLLDDATVAKGLNLASELFHRINRIVPDNQEILTVPPTCVVREAVVLMRRHGYSQIPVVQSSEVLGVFSYRSFAQEAASRSFAEWQADKCAPGDLRVEECLEQFTFARFSDEMTTVFAAMDRDNGVLVGTPERLQAILTPMDFLRYLHQVASPFVLVSEIELALRALLQLALTDAGIEAAAKVTLATAYGGADKVPTTLDAMTFDNYRTLIAHSDTWSLVEPIFAGMRVRTSAKLKEIGQLRNDIFHFRRELTLDEHQTLSGHRDWLLGRVRLVECSRTGGNP